MTPRLRLLCAIGLAPLAGCGGLSPEARCFAEATAEYRGPWREARRIEADLVRGHALHRVEVIRLAPVDCHEGGQRNTCLVERREWELRPVAIDEGLHRARLATLEARMAALRPAAMAAAAGCGYGDRAEARPPPE
ncbi:hypothetical protein [Sinisalibacter lacisalsi]|uniref:Lipoprotein n=1 Tax=Sinisalibacter lacisalsi TaxID=1526570 RepID=A0ABQ1QHW3_9RHOB|nr:hypothetical protein [Sinisalibacter lacisalsi]GGD25993.1 hypothetical protein GCM10011358_08050 [Sinisalibacter lacisalsi]